MFTYQTEPLRDSVILILGIVIWILLIKLSRSRRYRLVGPSFKLTAFSAISLLLILSFAGVQPLATYKDSVVSEIGSILVGGDDAAARRTVRATINAFNQGRGDRLADLTTPAVREELMTLYGWGALLGGVQIVDYSLSTLRSGEDGLGQWSEVRVRGGLRTAFGVDVYDAVFFVRKAGDNWIVASIVS